MKNELISLAKAVQDYQRSHGHSTAKLIRMYPDLGSDKTYGRILRGDTSEMDIEQQLINYRAVVAVIEAGVDPLAEVALIPDLSAVLQIRRAVLSAMRSCGNNRVVIVQGQSGIGKTSAIECIAQRYGSRVVRVEASEVWEDRPRALLGAILRALGQSSLEAGSSAQDRLERVQTILSESRRCLVIDEAHHLGKKCLNAVKTLVNSTPGEFILVAIPTLWAKLETAAYMEARQLSTNRLSERVQLQLTTSDIETYLRVSLAEFPAGALKPSAKIIADHAVRNGNFAFVRDVVTTLRASGARFEEATEAAKAVSEAVVTVTRRR